MSVRPMALHVYTRTHVCVFYEHNYYVVVRIGARMRTYAHVREGCAPEEQNTTETEWQAICL